MQRAGSVGLGQILRWSHDVKNHVSPTPTPPASSECSADSGLTDLVSLYRGDITHLSLDAIVNAANSSLLGGGGVDGAIHRAAGSALRKECALLDGCVEGEAKLTGGHNLPATHIIHTVGPRGERPAVLASCYRRCLQIASANGIRSLAFPCIATGIYGYPNESAARVALSTVRQYLEQHRDHFDRVVFCLFLDVDVQAYQRLMHSFFPLAN